jgi:segregation and condensation protein B
MSESENPIPLDIPAALEALLFVSAEPVASSQLELRTRGLRLQRHGGRVQLTTAPEMAELIEHFLGLEATSRLSRAALETLAIVAYQQPVTRPQIEAVRGVSSDGVMKSLLGKRLVQEMGRTEGPGRPILYGTSSDFLQYFGMNSLMDLPPLNLPEVENGDNHDETLKG